MVLEIGDKVVHPLYYNQRYEVVSGVVSAICRIGPNEYEYLVRSYGGNKLRVIYPSDLCLLHDRNGDNWKILEDKMNTGRFRLFARKEPITNLKQTKADFIIRSEQFGGLAPAPMNVIEPQNQDVVVQPLLNDEDHPEEDVADDPIMPVLRRFQGQHDITPPPEDPEHPEQPGSEPSSDTENDEGENEAAPPRSPPVPEPAVPEPPVPEPDVDDPDVPQVDPHDNPQRNSGYPPRDRCKLYNMNSNLVQAQKMVALHHVESAVGLLASINALLSLGPNTSTEEHNEVRNDWILRIENEDCLFLNIHTPKQPNDEGKSLPVLFYIHGGAFNSGSSHMIRPDHFMDEDVLFVSIQYRLDILGFLSTGDKVIRGNMGLKDQVQALKWVNENIQSFGGNPNKITILGHSAGGSSVHYLLLSPQTKGLFHKAISYSGAASNTWGFKSPIKSVEKTKNIANALGCLKNNSEELAECLRNTSIKDLMQTVVKDMTDNPILKPNKIRDPATPTIELVNDEDAFLTQHPLQVIAQGKAHRVPWMVGHTADEGMVSMPQLQADPSNLAEFEENIQNCLESIFAIDSSSNVSASEKANLILDFYLPPAKRSTLTKNEKTKAYRNIFSDAFFNFDIHESIFYQRQFAPVYPCFYSKTDGPTINHLINIAFSGRVTAIFEVVFYAIKTILGQSFLGMGPPQEYDGVNHAQDVIYAFPMSPFIQMPKDSANYKFSKNYIKLAVDFARDESSLTFKGVHFPATPELGPLIFLEITNDVPKIITEPFQERMKFLHDLKIRDFSPK